MKCCGNLVCREGDFSNRRKCHPREVIMEQLSTFLYTPLCCFGFCRPLFLSSVSLFLSLSVDPLYLYILLRGEIKKERHTQHILYTVIWRWTYGKDDSEKIHAAVTWATLSD